METRIHNDLELYGSMTLAVSVDTYPENPKVGTLIIKGNCLYAYISIGGYLTWYPFASKTNSYIHSQGIASNTWVITHNLNTYNTWTQIKDENGDVVIAAITNTSSNVITVNFTTPTLGTAIVVGPSTIDVPEMKAALVTIGDGTVVIDSDGIRIAGQNVLTSANIATEISSSITNVIGSLSDLTTTAKSNVVAAINEVKALAAAGTGTPGFTGSAGVAGVNGFTGSAGIAGVNGFTGSAGVAGVNGFTGSAGDIGFTGSAGVAGTTGFTGSTGAGFTGSIGFTGSASTIRGYTGSAGPTSWTPLADAEMTISQNNTFIKTSGTNGSFDGQVYSKEGYVTATVSAYMAGLNQGPNTLFGLTLTPNSTNVNDLTYAFLIDFNYITIKESGVTVTLNQLVEGQSGYDSATNSFGPITSGVTALQIVYDGTNVNYFVGSLLVRSTPRSISSSLLYFNSLFAYVNANSPTGGISQVTFGAVGRTGYTGSIGSLGFTGSAGAGFTGSSGAGFTGSQGTVGFTGSQGSAGSAGTVGFTGSQGTAGSAGTVGFTGSSGAGFTGSAGSAGAVGFTGSIGFTGSAGAGFTGSSGAGFTGSVGSVGFTGSSGASITSTANITTWTNVPYDIGSAVVGKPLASQIVLRFRAVRAFTIDSTGHQAFADIAATASTVFTIAKNSNTIGTVTFGAGATTSSVTVSSTSFAIGDKLVVTAPASADATLSDIDLSFVAKLD